MGIGGSSSKTDRSVQLQSFGNLNNLFNWALPTAKGAASSGQNIVGSGVSSLNTAGGYFKKLLSGSRSDLMQAEAPAINAARSGEDASKRQLGAMGTARGGGVSASSQTLDDRTRGAIDNALFGVRSQAAGGLAKVGAETGQLGIQELGAGTQYGMLGEYASADLGNIATNAKKQDAQTNQALGGAVGQILMTALMAA